MIILFNEEDMISFGSFIKSDKRRELYESVKEANPEINSEEVTLTDLDLWTRVVSSEE